jgi:hypothetical protein
MLQPDGWRGASNEEARSSIAATTTATASVGSAHLTDPLLQVREAAIRPAVQAVCHDGLCVEWSGLGDSDARSEGLQVRRKLPPEFLLGWRPQMANDPKC